MAICPCDDLPFPPILDIAAGLDRLPRQLAGLRNSGRRCWRGSLRSRHWMPGGRGKATISACMMIEWWAYILDVVAFYSSEIANELYLRTAQRDTSLRRLSELIGYTPKPPLAASATLALFAEPGQPVAVPAGTAFRSDAFDGEAPQIFEAAQDTQIDASLNEWTLAPIRPANYGSGPLLLDPRTAAISEGQIVLLEWSGAKQASTAIIVENRRLLDGEIYVAVTLSPAPNIPANQPVSSIRVSRPALRAAMNAFAGSGAVVRTASSVSLTLDALYSQLRTGHSVVIENAATGQLHAAAVTAVSLRTVNLTPGSGDGRFTDIALHEEGSPSLVEAVAISDLGDRQQQRGYARCSVHQGHVERRRTELDQRRQCRFSQPAFQYRVGRADHAERQDRDRRG